MGKGELFSLLGVNGAGKTTAIKMLSCLIKPTSGSAEVLGHSITREPREVKRLLGISPQETAVAPNLSVRENLALMRGICGHGAADSKAAADEYIGRFGMEGDRARQGPKRCRAVGSAG